MMKLVLGTLTLSLDEPCLGLSEVNLPSPIDGMGWRRYQVIYVMRGDKAAEARIDLGPADSFTQEEFRIPGGVMGDNGKPDICHSVGQLLEIAERLRESPIQLPAPPQDLQLRLVQQMEEALKWKRGQSVSGPHFSKERSL